MKPSGVAIILAHAKHKAHGGEMHESEHRSAPDYSEKCPGLYAAAEDILVALGQDYNSGLDRPESERNSFHDKCNRLADALYNFWQVVESYEDEHESEHGEEHEDDYE